MIDDDFPEFPAPDALPSLSQLRDTYRPNPHPSGPHLEAYTYLGVSYHLDELDMRAAERAIQEHLEDCETHEMDGCDPPAPYCGCSDCYFRATAGFWISYIMDALRDGRASLEEPPPVDPNYAQLELDISR